MKALSRQEKRKAKAGEGSSDKNKQSSKRLRVVNNPPSASSPTISSGIGGVKSPSVEKEVTPQEIQLAMPVVAQPTIILDMQINVEGRFKVDKSKKKANKKASKGVHIFSPSFHYNGKAIIAEQ